MGTTYYLFIFRQGTLCRRICRRNFIRASFDLKFTFIVSFLRVKSQGMATSLPPTQLFPLTHPIKNSITTLFRIVERSKNCGSGNYSPLQPPKVLRERVVGYKFLPLELVIGKGGMFYPWCPKTPSVFR